MLTVPDHTFGGHVVALLACGLVLGAFVGLVVLLVRERP